MVDTETTVFATDAFVQNIYADDSQKDDWLGFSVAAQKDRVVAGAPFHDDGAADVGASGTTEVDLLAARTPRLASRRGGDSRPPC